MIHKLNLLLSGMGTVIVSVVVHVVVFVTALKLLDFLSHIRW